MLTAFRYLVSHLTSPIASSLPQAAGQPCFTPLVIQPSSSICSVFLDKDYLSFYGAVYAQP